MNVAMSRPRNACDSKDATPLDMAETATALVEIGVRVIGGCCGTTPEHLAAMGEVLGEV